MSTPNQLYLLADHIKLSLLERQRAQTLEIDNSIAADGDSKDGHLSRSLEQFRNGLEALRSEQTRLEAAGDEDGSLNISDALPSLQKQYDDLTSQFHGFASPSTTSTLTRPNDPSLASDFDHATSTSPNGAGPASSLRAKGQRSASGKTVRFHDDRSAAGGDEPDLEAQRLFGSRYRDNPGDEPPSMGYHDEASQLDNQQIHAYHQDILEQQDEQLDRLGASISRQRELSMQIGDELDEHVTMLDDVDRNVDRHQGRIDRARRQVGRVSRAAGESKQMIAIIVLIVILILLIAILK